jgi:mono/diheme cytochrome c family protein
MLLAVAAMVYFAFGLFDIAATHPPGVLETAGAGFVRDASIRRRASREPNPVANDPTALATGLELFRADCIACHGAPGVPPETIGQGLNPPPPALDQPLTQDRPDGELVWIIQHGLRMTGMPAFGEVYGEPQVQQLAAFIKHLPQLTAAERASLQR